MPVPPHDRSSSGSPHLEMQNLRGGALQFPPKSECGRARPRRWAGVCSCLRVGTGRAVQSGCRPAELGARYAALCAQRHQGGAPLALSGEQLGFVELFAELRPVLSELPEAQLEPLEAALQGLELEEAHALCLALLG